MIFDLLEIFKIPYIYDKCCNHGCNNPQAYSSKDKNGKKRYRPVCSSCHLSSWSKKPLPEGVIPFKLGICCNQDGHLGFPCAMDYSKAPWAIGQTEIDHIDGNQRNNQVTNLQELCGSCHREKSHRNGDFKKNRHS